MIRYLLDTNHVSAVFNDEGPAVDRIRAQAAAYIAVPMPAVAELYFMIHNSARLRENRKRLEIALQDLTLLDFERSAAIEFGKIKSELVRAGRLIPAIDVQIAAVARARALVLLTADAHFSYVSGITCEDWTT